MSVDSEESIMCMIMKCNTASQLPGIAYFTKYVRMSVIQLKKLKNNARVAFIGIVNHNHFVLPMSSFIDFVVSPPKPGSFFRTIFGSAAFAVTKR